MNGTQEDVTRYLETILPQKIIQNNEELRNCKVIECKATASKSFDGFLSTIYQINLLLQDNDASEKSHNLNLIAKMMKELPGDFREDARLDEMTVNELVFYRDILPTYEKLLIASGGKVKAEWTPKFYYGIYGFNEDFGSGKNEEGVFVFENLTSTGFRMGPRDKLDEKHIMLMTESIARLHAASYALKIQNPSKFDEIVASFKTFPFHDKKKSMFDALYNIALERLYRHVEVGNQEADFTTAVIKVYKKYINSPSMLLQEFLDDDPTFNTIIHGDYNRNNVMFKYELDEGFEDPVSVKMFDFQWAKHASPVLDLSFYLYMNVDPEILESHWIKILKFYHETLITSIAKILNCSESDSRLKKYNFEDFLKHFGNFAFYGCLISCWFLPIMLADLETCKELEMELNKDLFSEASLNVCLPAGGKLAIDRVNGNVKHAFKNGYMNRLLN